MVDDWIDIKGFEGRYQINMHGKVKSLRGSSIKILSPCLMSGYLNYRIGGKTVSLHRLLAIHFIDNPENKPHVNHIDGDKLNNKLNNLEWVTHRENLTHSTLRRTNKKYPGVTGKGSTWTAHINFDGFGISYSGFSSEIEAAAKIWRELEKRGIKNKYAVCPIKMSDIDITKPIPSRINF